MPSINDNFAAAIEVVIATNGGTYQSPAYANTGNTTEAGEPAISASGDLSMWFKYTPASSGTATFDTQLTTAITNTDSYMAIWTGTALNNLVNVASNDDGGGNATSLISGLSVTAGITYWIQIGGFGFAQMNMVLRVTGPASASGGGGTTPVTATRSTTWDVRTSVTRTRAASWDTRAAVARTRSTSWDVRTQATAQRSTSWNVDGTVIAVTTTRSTNWRTRAAVAVTRATTWRVRAAATASRSTAWDTRTAVSATRAAVWDYRALVSAARSTQWDTRTAISRALAASWDVRTQVTVQRSGVWNVDSTMVAVTASRSTSWRTLAKPTSTRSTSWDTRAVVANSRTTSWDVRTATTRTAATSWRTLVAAEAVRSTSWRVLERAGASRSTTWQVDSDVPPLIDVAAAPARPSAYAAGKARSGLSSGPPRQPTYSAGRPT